LILYSIYELKLKIKKECGEQFDKWIQILTELLLNHNLIHSKDVRQCPEENCGFAGIVDINSLSDRIECFEPFSCSKCGKEWKDPLQREQSLLGFLRSEIPSIENLANNFRKVMIAEPCP